MYIARWFGHWSWPDSTVEVGRVRGFGKVTCGSCEVLDEIVSDLE